MTQGKTLTDLSLKANINLYYDLFVPENCEKAPLLLAVHGYGAHKRYMMREAQAIAPENFVIASVQAPHQHYRRTENGYRVGFGWLTDYKPEESIALHHNFVLQVIENLKSQGLIDEKKIYFYGFSQACALNFRFAFTYPEIPCGIIAVCGGVPGDLGTNVEYRPTQADVFYLYNDDDEFYSPEQYQSFIARLDSFLPNLQTKLHHSKHEIVEPMRQDIKSWLLEKTLAK